EDPSLEGDGVAVERGVPILREKRRGAHRDEVASDEEMQPRSGDDQEAEAVERDDQARRDRDVEHPTDELLGWLEAVEALRREPEQDEREARGDQPDQRRPESAALEGRRRRARP